MADETIWINVDGVWIELATRAYIDTVTPVNFVTFDDLSGVVSFNTSPQPSTNLDMTLSGHFRVETVGGGMILQDTGGGEIKLQAAGGGGIQVLSDYTIRLETSGDNDIVIDAQGGDMSLFALGSSGLTLESNYGTKLTDSASGHGGGLNIFKIGYGIPGISMQSFENIEMDISTGNSVIIVGDSIPIFRVDADGTIHGLTGGSITWDL